MKKPSFSTLLFSPASPSLRFLFSFLFFPAAQKTISPDRSLSLSLFFPAAQNHPAPAHLLSPARSASPLSPSLPRGPRPSGPSSLPCAARTQSRVRPGHASPRPSLGAHAKVTPPGPINSAVDLLWTPASTRSRLARETLAAAAIGARRARDAAASPLLLDKFTVQSFAR